jgi:hypothetical protein
MNKPAMTTIEHLTYDLSATCRIGVRKRLFLDMRSRRLPKGIESLRIERILCNAPNEGFMTVQQISVGATNLLLAPVDAFSYFNPIVVPMTMKSFPIIKIATPYESIRAVIDYSGMIPEGFSYQHKWKATLSFQGSCG